MNIFKRYPVLDKARKAVNRFVAELYPEKPITQVDPDNYGADSSSNDAYGTWKSYIQDQLNCNVDDKAKYADYEQMDSEIPEISAALDILADFVVYSDNINKTQIFKVKVKRGGAYDDALNKEIESIEKETNFKNELSGIIRDLCKYGDDVEELLREQGGNKIIQLRGVPVETFVVNINNGVIDKDFPIIQIGSDGKEIAKLPSDKCLHFTLSTDRQRYIRYGKGISRIEKSRLIYRQLRLMEEGLMIRRLSTSNSNYGIIVDVGDLMADEALSYIEKVKKSVSRRKYIDPKTGRISYKFNPLSALEDIMLPTRQGSGTNIIPLNKTSSGDTEIKDIMYFQDKMIYSTGVPKVLIGKEVDMTSKGAGDTQFVSFLRTIKKIQRLITPVISKFYMLALASRGKFVDEVVIDWPWLSIVDEKLKYEIEMLRTNIGSGLLNSGMIDDEYFYKNFMNLSDDEWMTLTTRMDEEERKAQDEFDQEMLKAKDMTNDPNAEEEFSTLDNPAPKVSRNKTTNKDDSDETEEDDEETETEGFERISKIQDQMSTEQKKEFIERMKSEYELNHGKKETECFEKMLGLAMSDQKLLKTICNISELVQMRLKE